MKPKSKSEFKKQVERTVIDFGIKDLESKVNAKFRVLEILLHLESNEDCYEYKKAFWTAVYEGVINTQVNN
jgi:hypothetical protein